MASITESEVVIQEMDEVQIQEVEVEQVPVEMPIETVETSADDTVEVQPMIALQPLPEPAQEEIVLQTSEEIVGDPNLVYVDSIPVPTPEVEISTDDLSLGFRRIKGGKKKGKNKGITDLIDTGESDYFDPTPTRKWEQKQVQIRTLEGEFSVTMWASGNSFMVL